MIRIYIPTGLPKEDGRLEFKAEEFIHTQGKTLGEYLADLQLTPELVGSVIYQGRSLKRSAEVTHSKRIWYRTIFGLGPKVWKEKIDEIESTIPRDGDEFHVIPQVEGKNSSIILGVVGAIIGFYTGGVGWAAFQAAMTGFAIGSTLGALLTPKPRLSKSGDDSTSYAWSGISNDDRAGIPVPIVYGDHVVGGVRIGAFIRREGGKEKLYMLILVSKGEVEEISEVEINGQPVDNFPNASIETRLGTLDQTPIKGFDVVANTYAQSAELTSTPVGYTTTTAVDSFEVLITVAGLMHTNGEGVAVNNTTTWKFRYKKST